MAAIQIKDYLRETNVVQTRILLAFAGVAVMVLILAGRATYVQVHQHQHYSTLSRDNRINLLPVPPVRGRVFDRTGTVLAENFTVYNLEVTPDTVPDLELTLDSLSQLMELKPRDMTRFRRLLRRRPSFESQTLKSNLTQSEAARFAVNRHRYPGVELQARLQRRYPLGALTGHVVGYVGRISESDLDEIDTAAYQGSDYIGKLGIESTYESTLLGRVGFEQVETNAHGRIVRKLARTPPISGHDLHLSIDAQVQRVAYEALADHEGAVVAIEPQTGDILAFVSKPAYDPNKFVNGIDHYSYKALRESTGRPLLNRAFNGRYAPGSTIKGVMGLGVLGAGHSPDETLSCPGWYSLPNSKHRYRCWKKGGHGRMNLWNAIIQSCDVYFYKRARELGITRLHEFFTDFGIGVRTGIDLEGEPDGLAPSIEWKRQVHDQPWYPGETVITGIGQGYMLMTPLQLAVMTATIANHGNKVKPRLVSGYRTPETNAIARREPDIVRVIENATEHHFDIIVNAMTDVVHGKRGTARRVGKNIPYKIAGKTGTAQVIGIKQNEKYDADKLAKRFHDHALFVAFAPLEDPKIAIAVIAENGGSGSRTAAPIASTVIDFYLREVLKMYPEFYIRSDDVDT